MQHPTSWTEGLPGQQAEGLDPGAVMAGRPPPGGTPDGLQFQTQGLRCARGSGPGVGRLETLKTMEGLSEASVRFSGQGWESGRFPLP